MKSIRSSFRSAVNLPSSISSRIMYTVLVAVSLFVFSAAQEQCGPNLTWSTQNGHILLNDPVCVLKGLDKVSLDSILDIVKANGFNALRMPFALETVLRNPSNLTVSCQVNPDICHMNALNLMDAYIDKCAERGILIMLDCHRINVTMQSALWYNNEYNETEVLRLWDQVLIRFASKWNVFALDIHNEPWPPATWGKNVEKTDWNRYAERFITHVAQRHPFYKGLFFVEGLYGGDLSGVHTAPIHVADPNLEKRVVYSPHSYGPEEYDASYFNATDFPNNMKAHWDQQYGFVQSLTGHPVVTGEWGWEVPGSKGEVWGHALASYLKENCMTNQYWWCLNPGKYGLLKYDWATPNPEKFAFLHDLQPNPTKFVVRMPNICVTRGTFVNQAC